MMEIYILWLRQVKRYVRSRSRIIGAVGQPLLFLLALGYGIGSIYKRAGGGNYIEFLVPGIIAQTILFGAIFWGINVIWDKMFGFLKETLVAPVSRLYILTGSALGGATTTVIQAVLVFVISLALGFHPYNWAFVPLALVVVVLFAFALTCFGAGLAAIVSDFQGFQAINQFLIFPLYFLSSALFPIDNAPRALKFIASVNPVSYAVDALRALLINQSHFGLSLDLLVLGITVIMLVTFGVVCFRRIEP
jgi:ABC-2 type transport system permease protein